MSEITCSRKRRKATELPRFVQAVHAKLDVFVDGTEADKVFVSRASSCLLLCGEPAARLPNRLNSCTA